MKHPNTLYDHRLADARKEGLIDGFILGAVAVSILALVGLMIAGDLSLGELVR